MIKLSESRSKAKTAEAGPLGPVGQVVKAMEKFLKGNYKCSPVNTQMLRKVKQPYCRYGGHFIGLDRRSNQLQYCLKPKLVQSKA